MHMLHTHASTHNVIGVVWCYGDGGHRHRQIDAHHHHQHHHHHHHHHHHQQQQHQQHGLSKTTKNISENVQWTRAMKWDTLGALLRVYQLCHTSTHHIHPINLSTHPAVHPINPHRLNQTHREWNARHCGCLAWILVFRRFWKQQLVIQQEKVISFSMDMSVSSECRYRWLIRPPFPVAE